MSCPICGADEQIVNIGQAVRCVCGMVFHDPMVPYEERKRYHDEVYFGSDVTKGYPNYLDAGHQQVKLDWGIFLYSWSKQMLGRMPRRVIDVGCAFGHGLVRFFEEAGAHCLGVDFSSYAIRQAGLLFPFLHFTERRFEDLMVDGFDVAVFWESFQGFDDPNAVLSHLYEITTDDMCLIIQVENLDSHIFDAGSRAWNPNEKCFYYNLESLQRLLKKNGFTSRQKVSPTQGGLLVWARKASHGW